MSTIKARLGALSARIGSLVRAIEESDEAKIEEAVLRLSGRYTSPTGLLGFLDLKEQGV